MVVSARVHCGRPRAVVDLLRCYRRGPSVGVVGHQLVLVGFEVHLLLVGHEVGDGEWMVEVVVGV